MEVEGSLRTLALRMKTIADLSVGFSLAPRSTALLAFACRERRGGSRPARNPAHGRVIAPAGTDFLMWPWMLSSCWSQARGQRESKAENSSL